MITRGPIVAPTLLFTLLSKGPGGAQGITVYSGPSWRAVAFSRGAVAVGSVLTMAIILALVAIFSFWTGVATFMPYIAGGTGAGTVHRVAEGAVPAGADL